MNDIKYQTTVVGIGSLIDDFLNDGILVFFGLDAPEELTEFSIIHQHTQLHEAVKAGDRIIIDETVLPVLAVGEVANENLANLGHFIIKFNGQTEPEMPGDICVPADIPLPAIKPGVVIKIVGD